MSHHVGRCHTFSLLTYHSTQHFLDRATVSKKTLYTQKNFLKSPYQKLQQTQSGRKSSAKESLSHRNHESAGNLRNNTPTGYEPNVLTTRELKVQTLIERKDAYIMQVSHVSQDRKTCRWSRSTIKMKVHVFSDSTLCVGVSNPHPSKKWATKLEDVWNEHGIYRTNEFGRFGTNDQARVTRCFDS